MEFLILTSLCLLTWFLYKIYWNGSQIASKYKNLPPPGPKGLPLVGNAFQLDPSGSHKTLTAWRDIYGDVFRIKIFKDNMMILNGYELIQEMLVTKSLQFADRPVSPRLSLVVENNHYGGLTFENYSDWYTFKKKAVIKSLKVYGEGRKSFEDLTTRFIGKLIDGMKGKGDQSFDVMSMLRFCVSGIIISLSSGEEWSEAELTDFFEKEDADVKYFSPGGIEALLDIWPALSFLPIPAFKDGIRLTKEYLQYTARKYQEWKKKPEGELNNSVDQVWYMLGQEKKLSDRDIIDLSSEMIIAGSLTTTRTAYALLGVLIRHRQIQEKMFEEIQRVTNGRKPTLDDRKEMHYTEATIHEITRFSSILPVLIPHVCREDTTLGGYDIPKGTIVLPNVWGLHHDSKLWDEPYKFVPERFLDEDGKLVDVNHMNRKMLMAFGRGRRACAGEQLARNRMFLLITHLVQEFEFLSEDPDNLPDINPENYYLIFVLNAPPYKLRVKKRNY